MKKFLSPRTRLFILCTVCGATLVGSSLWIAQAQNTSAPASVVRPIEPPDVMPPIEPPIWPRHPWPRPTPVERAVELQLLSQNATVEINGTTARTKLTQVFKNPTRGTIEGTYLFPLPTGAAVSNFAMTMNGKRVEAEVLPSDKARDIYEGIVRKLRDPAILEFADRNTLRARIFPLPAGAEQKLELEYSQTLASDAGGLRFALPQRLPVGGAAQSSSVEVTIRPRQSVRAVYSPTHDIQSQADGGAWRVSGEWKQENGKETRDFVLYVTQSDQRVGLTMWTQRVPGEDPYFMLLAAPDPTVNAKEIAAKDVVFTFDTSGSMSGEKIEQARGALLQLLGNLNPNDRFNIVTFSSDVNPFREALVVASGANIEAARLFTREIKAVGGTNIDEALQTSLKMFRNEGRAQQLVFMTDGQPTVGQTDVDVILKNARDTNLGGTAQAKSSAHARLFVFGVGYDVNTKLLDSLAEDNRGTSDYVSPEENIENKVGALYSKIAFPVLSNAQLNWGNLAAYDVYPKSMPDLFKGTTTVVFGRLKQLPIAGTPQLRLTGTANGQSVQIGGNWSSENSNDALPRLWATRKVGFLLDDARRNGREPAGEVREEIIALSKKFGIVTPLTAALITEDEPQLLTSNVGNGVRFRANTPATSRSAEGATADLGAAFGSTSGMGAVKAAKSTNELKLRERMDADDSATRFMEGKTFVLHDGVWIDSRFDAKLHTKIERIKFASPEYFSLAKDAQVAKWLSVGDKVLLVLNKRVIKIEG